MIIMTGNATLQRAIESIHLGVKDFLLKPFEIDTLVKAIQRESKIQKIQTVNKRAKQGISNEFFVVSKALEPVISVAKKAAKTNASILLTGESGVGKEVFAQFIHNNSLRAKKPFVAVNMAAIPENLIESELFGFVKGAFTDAHVDKAGQFELADGGTIFLDEIGEMPYHLQAKLLRVLQEKEVRRLGAEKPTKIDVRLISATNADLHDKIKKGEFREDLYYRLNTIPLAIPPLRKRKEEILPIAEKILQESCAKYSLPQKKFSEDAIEQLLAYDWPGNIRELMSVVERAVILSENEVITSEDLFLESRGVFNKSDSIESMERALIVEVLDVSGNDIARSAKTLGMKEDILKEKMKKYNIIGDEE